MNNKLSRDVVTAIMAGNDQQANKIFERAVAYSLQAQLEDYKAAVGAKMFESVDEIGGEFMPVKRDFTIHATDPSKKSDRFPEGEPVQYKTNSYSPRTAYKNAVANGHVVHKVVDSVGNEVTGDAKVGLNEAMRIVSKHGEGEQHSAKVYKDTDWGEYRVKFFKDGKHVGEDADYHTDDLDDAKSTADSQLKKYGQVNEDTQLADLTKINTRKLQELHALKSYYAQLPNNPYAEAEKDGANRAHHELKSRGVNVPLVESADTDLDTWKQKVKDAHPEHAENIKFKSADQAKHISAEIPGLDRSFGVYDIAAGKGHVLEEDTAVGNIDAQLTAQRRAEKDQEDAEKAAEASKSKAPTINDVVSVLGNTVSVADTSAVN